MCVLVGNALAHVDRVNADALFGSGKEQRIPIKDISRRRNGDAVIVAELLPLDLFVVDVRPAYAVRVLNKAVLPVKDNKKVLFRDERALNANVALFSAPDGRDRLGGQIKVILRLLAGELPHGRNFDNVLFSLLVLARTTDTERTVKLHHGPTEPLAVQKHHTARALRRQIFRIPDIVAQQKTDLNGLHILRADHNVRRAPGSDKQLRALFAVHKAIQIAFADFQNDIFQERSPFLPLRHVYYTIFPAAQAIEPIGFVKNVCAISALPRQILKNAPKSMRRKPLTPVFAFAS